MTMIQCISPVDGSVYAERSALSLEAAKDVVARARKAQRAWAKRPLEERVQLVLKGVARLNEMSDLVVPELAWQMGRPVKYGGEYRGFNERSNYVASIAADALAPLVVEESDTFERRIEREAHGVVFVIAPWNYPYMTAINTIAPALMAGNTVILKHASQTLLVGERLVQAFVEAGVPEDVFQNVFLDHETTSALIAAGSFNFINFTGSVEGGRSMERAAAGTFTGLGLELGGKDPGYVMEDADLDAAVDTLMDGATYNSGQCCCGIERIYVHESLYDSFVEKSVAWVSNYKLGNPLDPETSLGPMANKRFAKVVREQTSLGPMANKRFAKVVREQIADAVSKGARTLIDPKLFPQDDGGAYLAPQILGSVNVDHSMAFMREETFGPAVGIMKVKNDAEAIALMNDSQYGLTASLWTKDPERAGRLGREIETGTVFMNRADYLDPALCWTGVKETGRGGSLSIIGFHNLTRPKSYHLKKVTA
ncbi:aldehyde dehydrogenase family protein [Rhizobium mongolense]